MTVGRRTALGASAAGALGLAGWSGLREVAPVAGDDASPLLFHSPAVQPFRDELPVLPMLQAGSVALTAVNARHRFHRDYGESTTFAYTSASAAPTYLGPVLEAVQGAPSSVTLTSQLGPHVFAADVDPTLHGADESERQRPHTTLHLHGGVQPALDDGHPEDFLVKGEQLTNDYLNEQAATQLWYHDHSLGTTRLNVYAGLAAPYLVRDRWDTGRTDNPLGLPAGPYELPLVLQEKIFTADGQQSVRSTPLVPQGRWEGGAVGDRGLVNGVVWPRARVARGLYRFRVLAASSFSVWNLYFSNRMRFWVIGTDGGLLDAPAATRSVRIGPAERVDLLVDFSGLAPGESVELRNDEPPAPQAAQLGEQTMPLFCRFEVGSSRGFRGAVPSRLRGGRGRPPRLPAVTRPRAVRNLTISQPYDATRFPPYVMSLNNLTYADDEIELPRQGTTEVWNLINVTGDPHSIHIHLINFRILERRPFDKQSYTLLNPQPPVGIKWTPSAEPFVNGKAVPPPATESGWKDTVRCDAGTITRVAIRWPTAEELGFDPDAAFLPHGATARAALADPMPATDMAGMPGLSAGSGATHPTRTDLQGYMWHCHMLDHEDHDMMLRFRTPA